jgi:hypothetical protein
VTPHSRMLPRPYFRPPALMYTPSAYQRLAVVLNNTGVSLLRKGDFSNAISTIRDGITVLRMDFPSTSPLQAGAGDVNAGTNQMVANTTSAADTRPSSPSAVQTVNVGTSADTQTGSPVNVSAGVVEHGTNRTVTDMDTDMDIEPNATTNAQVSSSVDSNNNSNNGNNSSAIVVPEVPGLKLSIQDMINIIMNEAAKRHACYTSVCHGMQVHVMSSEDDGRQAVDDVIQYTAASDILIPPSDSFDDTTDIVTASHNSVGFNIDNGATANGCGMGQAAKDCMTGSQPDSAMQDAYSCFHQSQHCQTFEYVLVRMEPTLLDQEFYSPDYDAAIMLYNFGMAHIMMYNHEVHHLSPSQRRRLMQAAAELVPHMAMCIHRLDLLTGALSLFQLCHSVLLNQIARFTSPSMQFRISLLGALALKNLSIILAQLGRTIDANIAATNLANLVSLICDEEDHLEEFYGNTAVRASPAA